MVRKAEVSVMESKMVSGAVIGELDKSPEAIGDLASVKEAHLLREEQVSVFRKRPGELAIGQRSARSGIGNLQTQTDWRQGIDGQRLPGRGIDSRDLFDVVENVPVQLEFPP